MKKFKLVNLNGNRTQSIILLLAAAVPAFSILIAILGILSGTVFHFIIPFALVLVIASTVYLFILLIQFFKGISLIDQNAVILSQGNLNISDIIAEKTKGLEILTSSFNDMKRNLLSYIESTKSNVIILSDAVDKVTKSIDMTYTGNEQIAANMSIVAEKAQEQLKIAKSTLEGIEKVSLGASKITSTLANIEGFVETTVKLTSDGAHNLDKYNDQMQNISTNLEDTSNFLATLNSHLSEINQFGSLIMNITGQLNLLSLNSQVEAARAGAAGRGFSVVAQEMNKLSAATKDSVTQINKLLTNILKSNAKVSESINNVTESFSNSKEIFVTVKESFYTINNNANILNSDIKEVYEESLMISENTKEISKQGASLHDSSNEISSITQDVAAVTEEELAENEEINSQAISLKKMLSSIESLLKRYKTSVAPVSQASNKHLKLIMMSPIDHPFWLSVRQGALYAQTELKGKNLDVEFIGFEKVDQTFINTLNEKIEEGCDGLILPGFINGIEKCVEKADLKKIPVMAFNCDFPDGTKRLSYFGPDVRAAGALAGEMLAKGIEEAGEVIIFKGDTKSAINIQRRDAAVAQLAKYKNIKIISEVDDMVSSSQVAKKLKETLYYLPNVKGILFVSGGATGAARVIEEMNLIGKLKVYCFDYDDEILGLIKKGIVHKAMGQDPFGQGHDPIIYLYNYLVANEVPENITYTRTEVIDGHSVAE
ncbi:MAG TPA: substrate-binding domain-containing protein [Mobilitalea sp.]|nr:substrate-binding domain-containing protein [Mobilitalea sp.]